MNRLVITHERITTWSGKLTEISKYAIEYLTSDGLNSSKSILCNITTTQQPTFGADVLYTQGDNQQW